MPWNLLQVGLVIMGSRSWTVYQFTDVRLPPGGVSAVPFLETRV